MSEQPTTTSTEVPSHEGPEPTFLGLNAPAFISLAMIVVIAIIVWKKVPAAIGKALDDKIAVIRDQLAEAESLRKEAEALKAEYRVQSQIGRQGPRGPARARAA